MSTAFDLESWKGDPVPKRPSASRGQLAEQAYLYLRDQIVRGELRAGEPVAWTGIATSLGMSRTPVREAMVRLELEGYLSRDDSNRLTVHVPTRADVVEHFWLRELLETHAARLAARRVSDAELERLAGLVEHDRHALSEGRIDNLALANSAIHDLILQASRNRPLLRLVQGLRAKFEGIQRFAVGSLEDQGRFVGQHAEIVGALRDGDAHAAIAVTRDHLRRARDILLEALGDSAVADAASVPGLPDLSTVRLPGLVLARDIDDDLDGMGHG